MNASERLDNVDSALAERGVRDVKFFFDASAFSTLASDVKKDVAYMLEQYVAGNTRDINDFSHEVLPA